MIDLDRKRAGILPRGLPAYSALMVGLVIGIGSFTFAYGEGAAYLSNDPGVCMNCHVMQGHFDSWESSSHGRAAVCNDCHLPPDFFGKWLTKADNGLLHSVAFTTGIFPDPIRIKPRNARRTQEACLVCHSEMFHRSARVEPTGDSILCAQCHSDVGHALR